MFCHTLLKEGIAWIDRHKVKPHTEQLFRTENTRHGAVLCGAIQTMNDTKLLAINVKVDSLAFRCVSYADDATSSISDDATLRISMVIGWMVIGLGWTLDFGFGSWILFS